ncbi:MAG: hypothetical protein ACK4NY_09000 [Spirosomataceae bacterium]
MKTLINFCLLIIIILIANESWSKPLPQSLKRFAKSDPLNPCDANAIRSFKLESPGAYCPSPTADEHAFSVFGAGFSAGAYVFKENTQPLLVEYNDGTIKMRFQVVNKTDATKEYIIDFIGSDKTIGNPSGGFTPATNTCSGTNTTDWTFYNTFLMTITGEGSNSGQFAMVMSPQGNQHTFQIGTGANMWQANFGAGLWFDDATPISPATFNGDIQVKLVPYECCIPKICTPYLVQKSK